VGTVICAGKPMVAGDAVGRTAYQDGTGDV